MKLLIKTEFLTLLLITLFIYFGVFKFSFLLFTVLLFSPDLAILGYGINNRVGAFVYNLVHSLIFPSFLLCIYFITNTEVVLSLSLIAFAHIFMDRLIGYGMKYETGFKHTHLDNI